VAFRGFLAALLAFALGGCWIGDAALFGPEDRANVALEGAYQVTTSLAGGAVEQLVRLDPRPDGRIVVYPLVFPDGSEPRREDMAEGDLHLIAITGAPEGWHVAFITEEGAGEAQFYIAAPEQEPGGEIAFYAPNCAGTTAREGMERLIEEAGADICRFSDKEALLGAAREAVALLSKPQIVVIEPILTLRPVGS
jgi:hypothetical protein